MAHSLEEYAGLLYFRVDLSYHFGELAGCLMINTVNYYFAVCFVLVVQ